jgi:type IV pilus assembly protein PilW
MKISNHGFTLTELLVAMAISGIVISAVYATYHSQQKAYIIQEEVAAMQQKLRAAMYYMTQQIQQAGCNPEGMTKNRPRIITADVDEIRFTSDIRDTDPGTLPDGTTDDPYEDVTYSLYTSEGSQRLGVKSTATATNQPVVEYVDALNFVYLGENGNPTTTLDDILSVEVTLVVRAEREDRDYVNTNAYTNKQGDVVLPAQNDHFRRRAATVQIKCRNLGL